MSAAVRWVGDRAALIELDDNPQAVRAARALAGRRCFVDVVAGHRTVLVTWAEGPAPDLAVGESAGPEPAAPAVHELGVRYDGPDLGAVAAEARLSPEEVVARHVGRDYTVGFLGFQPGFAYLLGLDPRLEVARLDEPRTTVPRGSVGVAGPYTGIYPRDSPGGWRLLGRTDAVLFDPGRASPALVAPGDRVRLEAR